MKKQKNAKSNCKTKIKSMDKSYRMPLYAAVLCLSFSLILFFGVLFASVGMKKNTEESEILLEECELQPENQTEYERKYYEIIPEALLLLKRYREINDEVVGIITIPDTILHHPLMQSPRSGECFYLSHDLYRNHNFHGIPFLTLNSNLSGEDGNCIIYGHNIIHTEPHDVFCDLVHYEELSYYKKHPVIEVVTEKGTARYLIFLYAIMDTSDSDSFVYWEDTSFPDDRSFNEYMSEMEKRNWIKTELPITRYDAYLTISTCSLELAHSGTNRMVVMAKRMAVGEEYETYVNASKMKENPLLPQKLR